MIHAENTIWRCGGYICGLGALTFLATTIAWAVIEYRSPNRAARIKETLAFVFGMDEHERGSWTFSPEIVDFSNTNCVYVVEFNPERALVHRIMLRFDERIRVYLSPGRMEGFFKEDMLGGMEVCVTVRNCLTRKVLTDIVLRELKPSWVYEPGTNHVARVECELGKFCPYLSERHYREKLKVQVRLVHGPYSLRIGDGEPVRLVVEEGYPFR